MRYSFPFDIDGEPMVLQDAVVLRVVSSRDAGHRFVVEFPNIEYEVRLRLVEILMQRLDRSTQHV